MASRGGRICIAPDDDDDGYIYIYIYVDFAGEEEEEESSRDGSQTMQKYICIYTGGRADRLGAIHPRARRIRKPSESWFPRLNSSIEAAKIHAAFSRPPRVPRPHNIILVIYFTLSRVLGFRTNLRYTSPSRSMRSLIFTARHTVYMYTYLWSAINSIPDKRSPLSRAPRIN